MTSLAIDHRKTALVLIDLQQSIVGRPCPPHAGPDGVRNSSRRADKFRALGSIVVLVRAAFQPDAKDFLHLPSDVPMQFDVGALPPGWAEIVPELGPQPGDLVVTKRQWGAFYGTELDLQLRRREVRTIIQDD
jgi:nicotinamidase-related amidase